MKAYSATLDRALALAASAHRSQVRKGTEIPYIQHPVHVGFILLKHGFAEEIVVAGVLHDVVEDTSVTLEEITQRFGPEVARLVAAVSEQKTEPEQQAELPWRVRKEQQLQHLEHADRSCAALKAADALHNCQSTLADLLVHGAAAWGRFKAPRQEQLWYYGSLARLCGERLGPHPLCAELEEAVAALVASPA